MSVSFAMTSGSETLREIRAVVFRFPGADPTPSRVADRGVSVRHSRCRGTGVRSHSPHRVNAISGKEPLCVLSVRSEESFECSARVGTIRRPVIPRRSQRSSAEPERARIRTLLQWLQP